MLVVESREMKRIEQEAAENSVSMAKLMEQAGTKVASYVLSFINKERRRKICILCGAGNNGGDGFVAARLLAAMGNVTVVLADGKPRTELALASFKLIPQKVFVFSADEKHDECIEAIKSADIIIDAIYGIGFRDALNFEVAELVDYANNNKSAVRIAVDLPSGIICDTGEIRSVCFHADHTIAFTALKPLHVLYPSMDYCGEVTAVNVGIPQDILNRCAYTMMTTDEFIARHPLIPRRKSAHKGINGTLLSVCGSYGMAGAAMLADRAALRSGAGLVKAAVPESIYPIMAGKIEEAVFLPLKEEEGKIAGSEADRLLDEIMGSCTAVLIGCGIGKSSGLTEMVTRLVESSIKPLVIDADGINAICGNINILKGASVPIILTPHPGEMARLTGTTVQAVQTDRYNTARSFAMEYGVTVVLKGANTIIACSDGSVYVNLTGNNGMAKGGSGDVLAGMIASFLAQGLSCEKAAAYGVYYHGLAGDLCAKKYSARTMLPSDIINELKLLNSQS